MTDQPNAYWLTTGLTPQRLESPTKPGGTSGQVDLNYEERKEALHRAHEIRQFEIELYWKRATYFWVLQAAVFTAFGLTWNFKNLDISPVVPIALAALGCVTSLAGWLSAKGSKFWQENWEFHIDMLEDEFEGRLHKTAYVGKGGIAWSVSGVNDHLAVCFGVFWIAMLVSATYRANPDWFAPLDSRFPSATTPGAQSILVLTIMTLAVYALWQRRTKFEQAKAVSFHEAVPTIEGSDCIDPDKLPTVYELSRLKRPFLVRRVPKI